MRLWQRQSKFDDRVEAKPTGKKSTWASFWNFLGAFYLEGYKFEPMATTTIDGSVIVISGRTTLYKTFILIDQEFRRGLLNEFIWFGKYGPIKLDDDNSSHDGLSKIEKTNAYRLISTLVHKSPLPPRLANTPSTSTNVFVGFIQPGEATQQVFLLIADLGNVTNGGLYMPSTGTCSTVWLFF